jgi:hypothetical protein
MNQHSHDVTIGFVINKPRHLKQFEFQMCDE